MSLLLSLTVFAQDIKLEHFLCDCHYRFQDGVATLKKADTLIYLVPFVIYNNNVSKIYSEYHYKKSYSENISTTIKDIESLNEFEEIKDLCIEDICEGLNSATAKSILESFKYGYINDWSWDLNSANGIDFNITYTNTNKKTIKYIDIYFIVKNPVGDICSLRFDRTNTGHLRCVGPIEQYHSGKYSWDAAYYTSGDASNMYFKKFVITYMDNTKYTLVKELAYREYINNK